jgi:hypothetical protein
LFCGLPTQDVSCGRFTLYRFQPDTELTSEFLFSARRSKLYEEVSNMHNRICKYRENELLFCALSPEGKGTVFLKEDYSSETTPLNYGRGFVWL